MSPSRATSEPTSEPTVMLTPEPSAQSTDLPTHAKTMSPSRATSEPSAHLTRVPIAQRTDLPTHVPSEQPTSSTIIHYVRVRCYLRGIQFMSPMMRLVMRRTLARILGVLLSRISEPIISQTQSNRRLQGSANGISVEMNVISEPDDGSESNSSNSTTAIHNNSSSSSIIETVSKAASNGGFQSNLQAIAAEVSIETGDASVLQVAQQVNLDSISTESVQVTAQPTLAPSFEDVSVSSTGSLQPTEMSNYYMFIGGGALLLTILGFVSRGYWLRKTKLILPHEEDFSSLNSLPSTPSKKTPSSIFAIDLDDSPVNGKKKRHRKKRNSQSEIDDL